MCKISKDLKFDLSAYLWYVYCVLCTLNKHLLSSRDKFQMFIFCRLNGEIEETLKFTLFFALQIGFQCIGKRQTVLTWYTYLTCITSYGTICFSCQFLLCNCSSAYSKTCFQMNSDCLAPTWICTAQNTLRVYCLLNLLRWMQLTDAHWIF